MPTPTHFSATNSKGKTYFLHSSRLKNSTKKFYYFAGEIKPDKTAEPVLPKGYEIGENGKTHLPFLRRIEVEAPAG